MGRFVVRRLAELAVAFVCLVGMADMADAKKAPASSFRTYDCHRTAGGNNLTSGRIIIAYDAASGLVFLLDEVIYQMNGKQPMMVKVTSDTASRLDLSWEVKGLPLSNSAQTGRGIFHVTFFKGSLTYMETALLSGFDNAESASGSCKLAG